MGVGPSSTARVRPVSSSCIEIRRAAPERRWVWPGQNLPISGRGAVSIDPLQDQDINMLVAKGEGEVIVM